MSHNARAVPTLPIVITDLLAVSHPVVLGPGAPATALRDRIARAAARTSAPCAAGLWLRFDFLDAAHEVAQSNEGDPDHDIWHAILHRREPDAWNAKYWWRRVGAHPVLAQLRSRAPEVGYAFTTPEAFVDFCERVRDTGTADEETAKRVQQLEWDLLFAHCAAK